MRTRLLHLGSIRCVVAGATVVVVLCITLSSFGQSPSFTSAHGKYEAAVVQGGLGDKHYEIKDVATGKRMLLTHSKYPDRANNVKDGSFSPDETKFAAAYHYGPDARFKDGYTWIRVWDIATRRPLRTEEKPGFVGVDESIFSTEGK